MKKIKVSIATILLFCLSGFAYAGKADPFVFIPKAGKGPFPVAVWLHGYRGYSPAGYFPGANKGAMQAHAEAIGAVIFGFPGTTDLGDDTQQWSEEPVADHAYIQSKLYELSTKVTIDKTKVVLFGFSQGAMVAADLATIFPESYKGAILMSPGGIGDPKATGIKSDRHRNQVYYVFCGAEEHPGNVELTEAYAKHLEEVLDVKVNMKLYAGVKKHTRPPDFMIKFPEWVSSIIEYSGEKK